jgi:hypothetical protein
MQAIAQDKITLPGFLAQLYLYFFLVLKTPLYLPHRGEILFMKYDE